MNKTVSAKFLKFLAVLAASLLFAPWCYTICARIVPFPPIWFGILIPLAGVPLGYGMMTLTGSVLRIRRPFDYAVCDDSDIRFEPKQAALPLGIDAVLTIVFISAFSRFLTDYAAKHDLSGFDKASMVPLLIGLLFGGAVFFGIFLWFFPFYKIISTQTIIAMGLVGFADIIVNLLLGGIPLTFLTVCVTLWLILSLAVLNQGYLTEAAFLTSAGKTEKGVRVFNFGVTIALIAVFLVAFALAIVVVSGVTTLIRLGFYLLVLKVIGTGEEDAFLSRDERVANFNHEVFSSTDFTMVSSSSSMSLFFLFLILLLAVAGFLIVARARSGNRAGLLDYLRSLWQELIDFFRNVFYIWSHVVEEPDDDRTVDYVDTTVKMDKDAVSDGIVRRRKSWRSDYAACRTQTERIRCLYRAVVKMWKDRGIRILSSDTPDEIRAKLSGFDTDEYAHALTDFFILCHYGEKEPTGEEMEKKLEAAALALDRWEA